MTTAARPTFEPARGGQGRNEKDLSAISRQYSSRDLPGHTKLKYREQGQGTVDEIRSRDFRRELEERERDTRTGARALATGTAAAGAVRAAITNDHHTGGTSKRQKLDQIAATNLDADDPVENDDSDADEDSDEDDMESLVAELNKIKKERAMETAKREVEKRQEEERIRMENILSGNPLLTHYSAGSATGEHKVKRRWDDDVVFKNCSRSEPEKSANNFINDSLRSEFHKKFMEKYVK